MIEPHVKEALTKNPPHAPEAEAAVLGCILVDCKCLSKVFPLLPSGDWFARPSHGRLYDTMLVSAEENAGVLDIVILNQKLEDTGDIKMVGGLEYLCSIIQEFPSATNAVHYARLVRMKHLVHLAIEAGGDLVYGLYERPDEIGPLLSAALGKLDSVRVMLMNPVLVR